MSAQTPQPFGPFTLIDALAQGGMGEVWLAAPHGLPSSSSSPDICVVKRVKSALADDDDTVQRFIDESRLGLLLRHPCVCRTLDAGREGGQDYLAVELVEGIDVRALAERAALAGRPIDEALALWIAINAFDGLAYAHGAAHPLTNKALGVVHRDISPHNLMAGSDGVVRVIDFGLALSSVREARTEQGIVMGKLAYMSPEQARGDGVDSSVDVYAMGVSLYELLARQRYWGTLSANDIWQNVGRGTYRAPHLDRCDEIAGGLLSAALSPDKAMRPSAATARDVLLVQLTQRYGGAELASRRLRGLVEHTSVAELTRMRTARETARTLAPPPASRSTVSLALTEVQAVLALLQTPAVEPKTQPPDEAPTLKLAAAAPTVIVPRATAAPSTPPPPLPPPPKKNSAVPLIAAAVAALVIIIGVGVGVALSNDAPVVAVAPPAPPPAPPVAVALVDPVEPIEPIEPLPPPPSPVVVEPPPPTPTPSAPAGDPLLNRVKRKKNCEHPCATSLFPGIAKRGAIDPKFRQVVENCLNHCP